MNTDSLDLVTQALVDKLKANAAVLKSSDNQAQVLPERIFYGDQAKLPTTPAICVEPAQLERKLQGVSYRTDNDFTIYILVYYVRVDQTDQLTRKQAQEVAETVETLIHQDPQLGGLLIHCFCPVNESGYTYRAGTMYRSNRITFQGYSKTRLR